MQPGSLPAGLVSGPKVAKQNGSRSPAQPAHLGGAHAGILGAVLFGLQAFVFAPCRADDHWAFRQPERVEAPAVHNHAWPRNDIDRFILAKLEDAGLAPTAEADRRALIRRLTFDLTGLPPTPEEVRTFLADPDPDAYDRLVDRLLSSPRYGERWARHWLDVVHFGETHGYDKDKPRPHAWPYRDYVIRSFNTDKPYSRFVAEQIAGDALFPEDPDGVIALGFIAAGPWDFVGHAELPESKTDGLIARYNDRDDMVMTTMSTFMSLTVHCARCHDHKFDPIPQRDYYALQAVFAGVDRADRPYDRDPKVHRERQSLLGERSARTLLRRRLDERMAAYTNEAILAIDSTLAARQAALSALDGSDRTLRRDELRREMETLHQQRTDIALRTLSAGDRDAYLAAGSRLEAIEARLKALPKPDWVYAAASDFAPQGSFQPAHGPREVHLLRRGDVRAGGDLVAPGTVTCFPWLPKALTVAHPGIESERRVALARWLIDTRNLQLRRSWVNRVWHYHFGRGIVDTPNDFGRMGSPPSHPALLDWLAFWFQDTGESLKALHRLILTSATYRQGSALDPLAEKVDAENRLLSRMNRSRLDAECLHDALLAVSGRLDATMGGPSVQQFWFKDDHSPTYDYTRFDVESPGGCRRSIYRFIVRSVPDPFLETLDCPDPSVLTPARSQTLTPLQALALLNNPFVLSQAAHFAERLRSGDSDLGACLVKAYQQALGRDPTPSESGRMIAYATRHGLDNACRLLFNSNEFSFID